MVKRVLLHIGMHKSGTTALQASLKGYDDGQSFYARLWNENHSIPIDLAFGSEQRGSFYQRLFNPTDEELRTRRKADLETLEQELARSDRERVILSAEGLSMLPQGDKAAVIRFLQARVSEIEVVCYVRDPLSFAASIFQQRVKWHRPERMFEPENFSPRYKDRLAPFTELLGRDQVRVVAFDRAAFANGSVVDDFAQRFGLQNLAAQTANESMSLSALRLLLAFNQSCPLSMGDAILTRAKERLIKEITQAYGDAPPIDKTLFRAVADYSETGYLRDAFGVCFAPPDIEGHVLNQAELEAALTDLAPVDPTPLDALLDAAGLGGRFTGMVPKLIRLFYQYVAEATADMGNNPRFLSLADGNLLRDTGLALARRETPAPDTALALLDMAVRAKPRATPLRDVRDSLRARLDARKAGRTKAP